MKYERYRSIGGSDAARILSGKIEDWQALWEEMTGRAQGKDLSYVFEVQLGTWSEPFNRSWFEKTEGRAVDIQVAPITHPDIPYLHASFDGILPLVPLDEQGHAFPYDVLECKHTNARATAQDVLNRYYAQAQHYLLWPDAQRVVFSVIYGNSYGEPFMVEKDPGYQLQMLEAYARFWRYVETDTPPLDAGPAVLTPKVTPFREVDMMAGNQAPTWEAYAVQYADTKQAAADHETAKAALKGMIPDDVRRAYGAGIEITVNKRGAKTVKLVDVPAIAAE